MHYCYVLYDKFSQRTYVGYTVDPIRRLRQHQGIIKGGARYTTNRGDWVFLAIVASPEFTQNMALSFEWHVKHIKHYGINGRIISLLKTILYNKKFEKNSYYIYISSIMEKAISSSTDISILLNKLIDSEIVYLLHNDFKDFIEYTKA